MRLRRTLSKEIDQKGDGFSVRATINTVIAANVDERDSRVPAGDEDIKSEKKEVQDE